MKKTINLFLAILMVFSLMMPISAEEVDETIVDTTTSEVVTDDTNDRNLESPVNEAVNSIDDVLKGSGIESDPFLVSSDADLRYVAEKVNSGESTYQKAYYKLTNDIDLANKEWTPIGNENNKFTGTFDGTGFTISNLTINQPELEGAGLFGYIATPAKLTGITLENANVIGLANVGGLVGAAFTGTLENCKVNGNIDIIGNYKVGGLAGGGYAKILNCHVEAKDGSSVTGLYLKVDFEGDNVGGLIGFRGEGSTIITDNVSVSNLTIAGSRKVGGVVGSAFVDNQYSNIKVSNLSLVNNAPYGYASGIAKNQLCVGGVVGIFMKSDKVGTLSNVSVSDIDFSVKDPKVAEEDLPIMGIVSGGYRANSLSGASAPDGKVDIENVVISGNNTGMNADEKFPGSEAMNGSSVVFKEGTGTQEDPFMINNLEDLKIFANSISKSGLTYEGQFIKVKEGLVLDLTDGLQIGTSSHKFKGNFDGNGLVINNLKKSFFNGTNGATVKNIIVNGQTKALFAYVEDSTIQNIKLNDVNITGASGTGALITGNVKGTTTIDGVEVTGTIAGSSYSDYVGGIIGGRATMNDADVITIKNCVNKANITGAKKIGGILGFTNSSNKGKWVIENCENYGDVTSTADKDSWAGGIAGGVGNATVTSCVNEGKIQANTVAGGIVGTTNSGTKITDSQNTAEVICEGVAGGIIGNSSSGSNTVSKSANTGNITAVNNAGGIIGGTNASGDYIDNCYNGGDITATGTSTDAVKVYAGGIYGYNNSSCTVNASVNDGVIKAEKGTAYQIGKSAYWYAGATGSKNENCYYIENGTIYLASADGDKPSEEQEGMTRTQLADKLNEVGGIAGFWQSQNGSVQPDKLIPGALDDPALRVVVITDADGKEVEAYTSLEEAITAVANNQTIKLEKDVELKNTLEVTGNKEFTLDINGYDLTLASGTNAVLMNVGVKNVGGDKTKLTLTDTGKTKGKIESSGNAAAICVRKDASMITDNINIIFSDENHNVSNVAIQVQGELTVQKGTNITSSEGGISIIGKGSKLTFNGGNVEAEYYAITGNGSDGGSEIIVNGGTLKANNGAGIYHPQDGTLTINGGEITGKTGIQMCAGKLVISEDSKVKVTGFGTDERDSKGAGDGTIDDGSAISVINRNYPGGIPQVEIKGGEFNTEKGIDTILAYVWDANAEDKKYSDWQEAKEYIAVSGGKFKPGFNNEYIIEGCGLTKNEDGSFEVHEHTYTWIIDKEATCTEDGLKHQECTKCDHKLEAVVIKANGHNYEDGTCTNCGAKDPNYVAPVDTSKLQALVNDYTKLNKEDYTVDSWKAFEKVLNEAKTLLENEKAAQDEVDTMLINLKEVYEALKEVEPTPEPTPEVDTSKLRALVDELAKLDPKAYTEESYKVLSNALDQASKILNDKEATQEEVNTCIDLLNKAKEQLKEVEPTPEQPKPEDKPEIVVPDTGVTITLGLGASAITLAGATIAYTLKRRNSK